METSIVVSICLIVFAIGIALGFLIRKMVSEAAGLWIFAPEYNHSYPGYLKNLIDWLSRPLVKNDFSAGTTAYGKKVTISSAGGRAAGINSTNKLRELLDFVGMHLYSDVLTGISIDQKSFATDILSISDKDMYRLEKQAKGFIEFVCLNKIGDD